MSRALATVLLLGTVTLTAGLGRTAISDSDEAYYAEAGREMIQTGDWLTPHYNFEYRFQKPILFYWLVASAYLTAGVSEAAARFWSALAGLGLVWLTYAAGRRWFDEATGLLAGTIAATSYGYVSLARLALPDLPLACFVTAAIYFGVVALETPGAARSSTAAAGVAVALACLTKGPIGVVLPALVLTAVAIRERRTLPPWRAKLLLAAAVSVALAAPWYVAMVAIHGMAYARGFFLGDNLQRFATSRFNQPRVIWFYLPILAGGMLPWSLFFPLWIAPAWQSVSRVHSIGRAEWRCMLWAALPLIFFTVSVGKQPRYILPILPPLAVLMGRTLTIRFADATTRGASAFLLRACALAGGVLLVGFGALLARARPVLVPLDNPALFHVWVALVMASGIVVASVALRSRLHHIPWTLGAAAAVTVLALQYGILAPRSDEPVIRMAALLREHRRGAELVGNYRVMVRNLVFYSGVKRVDLYDDAQAMGFLASEKPVFCLIGSKDLDRLMAKGDLKVRRLESLPYVNVAAVKLRTLLWPDPNEDVTSALLVTNRP